MSATIATRRTESTGLGLAQALTVLVVLLASVAALGGLFLQDLYRDPVTFVPVLQGQDLVTLLAMPVMIVALIAVRHGSTRAILVWIGLLGYLLYTYTGASVGYHFNSFFLIYVAIFSLTVFALVTSVSNVDVFMVHSHFDDASPRRWVAAFLVLIGVMLAAIELGENVRYLTSGVIPKVITNGAGITSFVYVLDLGIIVPLAALSAMWLWNRSPWGDVVAGVVLIKGATMGLALLSMNLFSMRAGQGTDGLEILWGVIAFGSLGMSAWFLRHCRG